MNKQFDRYDTTAEYVQRDVTKWCRYKIVFSSKDDCGTDQNAN